MVILLTICFFFSVKQGIVDIEHGKKGHRIFEENLGIFLVFLSLPLIALFFLLLGQIINGCKVGKAIENYVEEYVGSERMEQDRKKRVEKMKKKMGANPKLISRGDDLDGEDDTEEDD